VGPIRPAIDFEVVIVDLSRQSMPIISSELKAISPLTDNAGRQWGGGSGVGRTETPTVVVFA